MNSQHSPVTPGTMVVLSKEIVAKLKLASAVGFVKSHYKDGITTITMAKPVVKKKCDACKGELRFNHRHGLGTCRACNKRFGATPTRDIQNIPTGMFTEISFPEDQD